MMKQMRISLSVLLIPCLISLSCILSPAIKNICKISITTDCSKISQHKRHLSGVLTVALLRSFAKSDDQYIGKPDALHGLTTGQYIRGKYDPRNVNPWCLSPPAVVFPGQYRRHRHSFVFVQTSFVSAVRRVGWLSSIICVKPQPLSTSAGQSQVDASSEHDRAKKRQKLVFKLVPIQMLNAHCTACTVHLASQN